MASKIELHLLLAQATAGKPVTKVPLGASSGITKRQWERRVRGEADPVELPATPRVKGTLKLRIGHGAV